MLSPLPALAAGLLALQTPGDTGIATFGEACLAETPMRREALADMAERDRWLVGQVEVPGDLEWRDIYRAGEAVVRLDQYPTTADSPGGRICVVLIGPAPTAWKDKVSALTAAGAPVGEPDAYDAEKYRMPADLELTVWDLPDGSRIHALLEDGGTLELSVNYPTGR